MFHFQFVVKKIDINCPEMRPSLQVGFGTAHSRLELPELHQGDNILGIGKNLAIAMSEGEISEWFQEYALCVFYVSVIGRLPVYFSLQNLDLEHRIEDQMVDFGEDKKLRVRLLLCMNWRYVEDRNFQRIEQLSIAENSKNQDEKKNTFLYGKQNVQQKKQKVMSKTIWTETLSRTRKQPIKKDFIKKNMALTQNKFQVSNSVYEHYKRQQHVEVQQPSFRPIYSSEPQEQQYFCPPMMEFTNQAQAPKPVPQRFTPTLQDNYSFQDLNKLSHREIENSKGRENQPKIQVSKPKNKYGFSKDEIRKLVDNQFQNNKQILVPTLENGKLTFKPLRDVSEQDIQKVLGVNQQLKVEPQQASLHQDMVTPIRKVMSTHTVSQLPAASTIEQNKMNTSISADYPEDFQSASIGGSHISKSSISKTRRREDVVEQSISEIYSQNFDSFSQSQISKSNAKKSLQDIAESIRSADKSQSWRKY